jgi:hypothetical protein
MSISGSQVKVGDVVRVKGADEGGTSVSASTSKILTKSFTMEVTHISTGGVVEGVELTAKGAPRMSAGMTVSRSVNRNGDFLLISRPEAAPVIASNCGTCGPRDAKTCGWCYDANPDGSSVVPELIHVESGELSLDPDPALADLIMIENMDSIVEHQATHVESKFYSTEWMGAMRPPRGRLSKRGKTTRAMRRRTRG